MRVEKIINGERTFYYVDFIVNTMTAKIRKFSEDNTVLCKVSDDFKYLILPEGYTSIFISGKGCVPIKKIKLHSSASAQAKDYNEKFNQ